MSKNNYRFLFGAAVGVAAGMWLNSKKGKVFRKDFTESVENYASIAKEELADKLEESKVAINEFSSMAKEELSKKLDESKNVIDEISYKAKDTIQSLSNNAEEQVDKVESGFDKGASAAKRAIENFDKN